MFNILEKYRMKQIAKKNRELKALWDTFDEMRESDARRWEAFKSYRKECNGKETEKDWIELDRLSLHFERDDQLLDDFYDCHIAPLQRELVQHYEHGVFYPPLQVFLQPLLDRYRQPTRYLERKTPK